MQKMQRLEPEIRMARVEEAAKRYSVGKMTMRTLAEEAGAVCRVGKVVLINLKKMDSYFDAMSGSDNL